MQVRGGVKRMYVAKIKNYKGNVLRLTQNEEKYQVLSIEGLNPSSAQVNRATMAGLDGSKFNSAKLQERNIVITLKLKGEIENNRIELYRFFKPKYLCTFFYKNKNRDVYIEGYTETVEITPFTNNETMQISIICPNPYFRSVKNLEESISKTISKFAFPFTIENDYPIAFSEIDKEKITNIINDSEDSTGMIVQIDFLGVVNKIVIKNTEAGEKIELKYDFKENDKVIINTNRGNKSINLIRDGINYNIFNTLQKGSVFLQLDTGDNFFSYIVDEGDGDSKVDIKFKHYLLYGGV